MFKLKKYSLLLLGILCLSACDTDKLWIDDSKVYRWQEVNRPEYFGDSLS